MELAFNEALVDSECANHRRCWSETAQRRKEAGLLNTADDANTLMQLLQVISQVLDKKTVKKYFTVL